MDKEKIIEEGRCEYNQHSPCGVATLMSEKKNCIKLTCSYCGYVWSIDKWSKKEINDGKGGDN